MRKKDCLKPIVFALLCIYSLSTVVAIANPTDSLRKILPTLNGKEKLIVLGRLVQYASGGNNSKYELQCIDDLEREAIHLKAVNMQIYARSKRLVCYYNYSMNNRLVAEMPENLRFFEVHNAFGRYYDNWNLLPKMYLYQRKYNTAIIELKRIYADARKRGSNYGRGVASCGLGDVYATMNNMHQAVKAFEEGMPLLKEREGSTTLLAAYPTYCDMLLNQKSYDKLRKANKEWFEAIDNAKAIALEHGSSATIYQSRYMYCYISMAELEIKSGNLKKAEQLLHKAEAIAKNKAKIRNNALLTTWARYYEAKGDYPKALEYNNRDIKQEMQISDSIGLMNAKEYRAELLLKANRNADAAELYDELYPMKDSLNNAQTDRQLSELSTLYGLDKMTYLHKIATYRLYASIIGILLLLVIVGIYFMYTRKLRIKNRKLYTQATELINTQKKLEDMLKEVSESNLQGDEILYRRLRLIVQDEQLFKDPEMNRDLLATRLNTNYTYLIEAIRKYEDGATVSDFLNRYRLQYAAQLLNENNTSIVSSVSTLSGFKSYSTFYRLFRNIYGLSPSEYQVLAQEKNSKKRKSEKKLEGIT